MIKNELQKFNDFDTYYEYVNKISVEEFVIDTRNFKPWEVDSNGSLTLDFGQGVFPVRETVLNSLLERYCLSGGAFRDTNTSDKNLAVILNELRHMLPEKVKIMVADGAINSINSAIYSHIPLTEVLDETVTTVSNFFNEEVRCDICSDYAMTYINFFTDRKFTFNGKERQLVITMSNSENGTGSLRYGAYVGSNIPVMSDLSIIHKKNSNMETVINIVSMLETVVEKAQAQISLLEKMVLTAPTAAIEKLGKQVGLPKKSLEIAKAKLTVNTVYTAADIYEMLVESVIKDGEPITTLERHQNDLVKLIGADWSMFMAKGV